MRNEIKEWSDDDDFSGTPKQTKRVAQKAKIRLDHSIMHQVDGGNNQSDSIPVL